MKDKTQDYSDFTTKKLSTKHIVICATVIFIIVFTISFIFTIKGIKPEISKYDTSYNQDNYKCSKATNCQNGICIYINENGEEEKIQCLNTNWYNQDTN